MDIHEGVRTLPSSLGVFLTIIVFCLMTGYTVQKANIWIKKDETEMMSIRKELYYGPDYVMDMSKGMYFAVALSAYDNERESNLDPSIAEIVFQEYEWGIKDNGEVF